MYCFGVYGLWEVFGFFIIFIFGFYYNSFNSKFEMDVFMFILVDINYDFKLLILGVDYYGIGRSFNIIEELVLKVYVDLGFLEFLGYV